MPEHFLFDRADAIATITFNRPERRNGLDGAVLYELEQLVREVRDDRSLRALILTGAGSVFCAGADPKVLGRRDAPPDSSGRAANPRIIGRIFDALAHLDQMTIGAINGDAIGGGWSFALAVDYAIAVPSARFWVPEVDFGVPFRGLPSVALATRMGPWLAKEAAILCRKFTAPELLDLRILNELVAPGDLMTVARTRAAEFASKAAKAAAGTKRDINFAVYGPRHY
jgi:enoyl-CoA hydratase/carnithine racemase